MLSTLRCTCRINEAKYIRLFFNISSYMAELSMYHTQIDVSYSVPMHCSAKRYPTLTEQRSNPHCLDLSHNTIRWVARAQRILTIQVDKFKHPMSAHQDQISFLLLINITDCCKNGLLAGHCVVPLQIN